MYVYIEFSELHCLVHYMFYAYVSLSEMLETVLLTETQKHSTISCHRRFRLYCFYIFYNFVWFEIYVGFKKVAFGEVFLI
jgi:hypothetical protein